MPSERAQIAQRIADFVTANDLDNPYGGEAHRLDGDRFYHVLLSLPRTLDGIVKVYGKKFIQVQLHGRLTAGSAVFESEDDALAFLRATLVDFDSEAANAVPRKGDREQLVEGSRGPDGSC